MQENGRRFAGSVRALALVAVITAIGVVVAYHVDDVRRALRLLGTARPGWIIIGALLTAGVYIFRGLVFARVLRSLGFALPIPWLWRTALVATVVDQVIPTAGASGYGYSVAAFRSRGVPSGQASLVALLELVSYGVAVATVFITAVVRIALEGRLAAASLLGVLLPGALIGAGAAWIFAVQRDRRRLTRAAQRWTRCIEQSLRCRGAAAAVHRFLAQYYDGKARLRGSGYSFGALVGLQYFALACDVAALYAMFVALGHYPPIFAVTLGFILAMAGATMVAVPMGGGSFEAILAGYLAVYGSAASVVIAATVLFRVVSFWLPASLCAPVLLASRPSDRRSAAAMPYGRHVGV